MTDEAFGADAARSYRERPPRQVPGYESLLRMSAMLLAERAPRDARMLVLGAGGGLELEAFASAHPGWHFDGIDPSAPMLDLARTVTQAHAARVGLHEGYVEDAPQGPYDGASALLTFHFIARDRRLDTLSALRRRLRAGAPLVVAHLSFAQDEPARTRWIARHLGFGMDTAPDTAEIEKASETFAARLTILPPDEEEAMLAAAGFGDVTLFYAGMAVRGWLAYAA